MKIVTIVGARPQFIKAAPVSRAIAEHNVTVPDPSAFISEFILHTGQHYDRNMSDVFFEEMAISAPNINLGIGSGPHGKQTGEMLIRIAEVLQTQKPDWVLIYGDTNSTLAGAIAASKLHIPVAHVEAGLRSFNMRMPEEINRILSDRISTLLFCPTKTAVKNLKAEGITSGVYNVGDVMYDASLFYREMAKEKSSILRDLSLKPKGYVLVTCHRAENTDNPKRLSGIVDGLIKVAEQIKVVFPLHPRTKKRIIEQGLVNRLSKLEMLPPVSFLDMVQLEESAKVIITDSGGVQKEAYFFDIPCITMRDETEWVETVQTGCNILAGTDSIRIANLFQKLSYSEYEMCRLKCREQIYGVGRTALDIIEILLQRTSTVMTAFKR